MTRNHSEPTATVLEYRLPLYPVTSKLAPRRCDLIWGGAYIERGNPTAVHRELLDVILVCARRRVVDLAGQLHVIFDAAEVQRMRNVETDWRGMRKLLVDLTTTAISMRQPGQDWPSTFPVLTFVGDASSMADRAGHQFPARMKRISFSSGMSSRLAQEARISMDLGTIKKLLALKHVVSRALARWCLSHSSDQHHPLAAPLEAIGAAKKGEALSGRAASSRTRERIARLREDAPGLAELGIEIDKNLTLHYRRKANPGVFIQAPCHA